MPKLQQERIIDTRRTVTRGEVINIIGGSTTADHGALAGLGDDDHAQYLLASSVTSRVAFAANWTDLTDSGATTLHSHGAQIATVATKSGDYTLTSADNVVVFTATATATLPAATGSGQTYRIICRAGTLTVDGNGSETVKGALTQTLAPGEDLIITDTASGVWE